MKRCPTDTRVAALVSAVLFCLAGFGDRPVRGVDARSTRLGNEVATPPVNSEPQTCSPEKNLQLTGAQTSFKIQCPQNFKLSPVEVQISSESQHVNKQQQQQQLDKAYRVTPAGSGGAEQQCATGGGETLETLAPGSTLKADNKGINKQRAQDEDEVVDGGNTSTVFTLELGDRQEEEKHFCYTCTDGKDQSLKVATSCSIFVKVPKKEDPSPENPPVDSGSSSPSVLAWLSLSVTGCVAVLLHHS